MSGRVTIDRSKQKFRIKDFLKRKEPTPIRGESEHLTGIYVRMPVDMKVKLEEQSRERGVSMAQIIREKLSA